MESYHFIDKNNNLLKFNINTDNNQISIEDTGANMMSSDFYVEFETKDHIFINNTKSGVNKIVLKIDYSILFASDSSNLKPVLCSNKTGNCLLSINGLCTNFIVFSDIEKKSKSFLLFQSLKTKFEYEYVTAKFEFWGELSIKHQRKPIKTDGPILSSFLTKDGFCLIIDKEVLNFMYFNNKSELLYIKTLDTHISNIINRDIFSFNDLTETVIMVRGEQKLDFFSIMDSSDGNLTTQKTTIQLDSSTDDYVVIKDNNDNLRLIDIVNMRVKEIIIKRI